MTTNLERVVTLPRFLSLLRFLARFTSCGFGGDQCIALFHCVLECPDCTLLRHDLCLVDGSDKAFLVLRLRNL